MQRKKDGIVKERKIDSPVRAIKQIQKRINKVILKPICEELPDYMTGSIKNRSIRNNALPHARARAVLAIDLTDCFPSINSSRVYNLFRNKFGYSKDIAKVLTKLTTYGDRLPQGAPTSPSLCNLILEPLANDLNLLALKNNVNFTQYIDDLTFSGTESDLRKIRPDVIAMIKSAGFKVNKSKLKLMKMSDRMEITGLVVNDGISVGRRFIRRIERDILNGVDETTIKGKIAHVNSVSKKKAQKLKSKLLIKLTNPQPNSFK